MLKKLLLLASLGVYAFVEAASARPDSRPFISGDSFRAIAEHVYDETTQHFDPSKVKRGDIVFINLKRMKDFFTLVHPRIKEPYILISHNQDFSAPGPFKEILKDPKLIAWFTQNPDIVGHPKLIPLPIGLSNKHWAHSKEHDALIAQAQNNLVSDAPRTHLLYVNFNVYTFREARQPVYDHFIKLPFCSWFSNRAYPDFLQDIAQSKFVLSPRGHGLDCHRTWEALYMGAIPVVKTSTLDPLYEDLPVLIVKDWPAVTAEFLKKKYEEMRSKQYDLRKLYFDYWHEKIKKKQSQCRE